MDNNTLIVQMIKDLRDENTRSHEEIKKDNMGGYEKINTRLDITNGNIKKIKKRQLYLRGILIGITITLFVLGFLPQRLYDLIKMVF